jgi:hypothetical protein
MLLNHSSLNTQERRRERSQLVQRGGRLVVHPIWNGFGTSKPAAAIKGGGSDRSQAGSVFLGFFCARLLLRRAATNVDHVAAGRLRRRRGAKTFGDVRLDGKKWADLEGELELKHI